MGTSGVISNKSDTIFEWLQGVGVTKVDVEYTVKKIANEALRCAYFLFWSVALPYLCEASGTLFMYDSHDLHDILMFMIFYGCS